CCDPIKPMSKIVFVSMVADRTKIIVCTFSTLPSDSKYWLLSTGVTHLKIIYLIVTCRGTVHDTKIIRSSTPIVGSCSIIPYNHNFLWRFKVAHSSNVSLSTILFSPLPIRPSDNS
ncbi:hypothetical protein EGW08_007725, partial [Elysia chlorotica]